MKPLCLMVRKLCADVKFSKCRSKVTVKFTCSIFMVPSERSCYKEQLMSNVKALSFKVKKVTLYKQTKSGTDRRTKLFLSGALLRWRHKNGERKRWSFLDGHGSFACEVKYLRSRHPDDRQDEETVHYHY